MPSTICCCQPRQTITATLYNPRRYKTCSNVAHASEAGGPVIREERAHQNDQRRGGSSVDLGNLQKLSIQLPQTKKTSSGKRVGLEHIDCFFPTGDTDSSQNNNTTMV